MRKKSNKNRINNTIPCLYFMAQCIMMVLRAIAKGQECVQYQREVFTSKRMNHVNIRGVRCFPGARERLKLPQMYQKQAE
jgi:hypothetical protein